MLIRLGAWKAQGMCSPCHAYPVPHCALYDTGFGASCPLDRASLSCTIHIALRLSLTFYRCHRRNSLGCLPVYSTRLRYPATVIRTHWMLSSCELGSDRRFLWDLLLSMYIHQKLVRRSVYKYIHTYESRFYQAIYSLRTNDHEG